jgi:hypothetical protein
VAQNPDVNVFAHSVLAAVVLWASAPASLAQAADSKPVYRCPGPPVLYTDALTPQEAQSRNCRTIEGAPVTIVQSRRPAAAPASAPAPAARSGNGSQGAAANGTAGTARSGESRVDPATQRARDSDARRILESELKREEERLAALQREFNNGEPERRGDERNFARYQERVAEMRSGISRKEADIAAIRRELNKLPPPSQP